MPLIIEVAELQPGMRLAEAFFWHGRRMLPGGKILTKDDVEILNRRYPELTLKVGDPVLDSVVDFDDDTKDRAVASTAQQRIAQSMSQVQSRYASHTAAGSLNFSAIKDAALSVMDYLKGNPVSAALLTQNSDPKSYLSEHTGNVFYLSIVLGSAVRDYVMRERMRQTSASSLAMPVAMNLLPLGLGAMFMDIGMYPIQHIFAEGYTLTDEDRSAIREHPNVGAEMLPDDLPAGVKMVVRTHHENYDGKGYPAGMAGASLHVFTRIIRICDAFDAGTAKSVYKGAKSPSRVLWEMCAGPLRKCFDPVLTKVFMSLIQPFPIGGKVKLADGRIAVVVRYNRKHPFKPFAIVAFDAAGERLPKEKPIGPIAIGEENELRIASVGDEDLGYIYDIDAAPPDEAGDHFQDVLSAAYP